MRLTDTCTITRDGTTVGGVRRCSFGHTGGSTGLESGSMRYIETARMIVEPDPSLAEISTPTRLKVIHNGRTYQVTAILPRYRTHGRLHHVSLDLQVVDG